MASCLETDHHHYVDSLFTGALLLSLALHAITLAMLPGLPTALNKSVSSLTVELQPPPSKPLPPPEPQKPALEKPKELPKKPPPQPKLMPTPPPRTEITQPELAPAPEPPPQVITALPKAEELPPAVVAPISPPEPPKPKALPEQDIEIARGNYGNLLSREFAKHKQYPRLAQMRGWQGTSKVELHIDAKGNITSSAISESSGFEVLDKQALEMVRKASPLPLPPEVLRGREFTIIVPVAFRLQ